MLVNPTPELIETLTFLSTGIAFFGCLIAAYTDFKWGIVPDKLNYSLITLGIALAFLRFDFNTLILVYGLSTGVFLIGLIAYLFGQLGGGDVKFFAALTLLLPFYPQQIAALSPLNPVPLVPYPFIVPVFFTSAVLAVFFVSIHYMALFWKDRHEIPGLKKISAKGLVNFFIVAVPLSFLWAYTTPAIMLVVIPIALGAFLLPFKKILLSKYVSIQKKVEDLNDDDVLALELMDEETKDKLGLSNRKTFFNIELKTIKEKARENNIKEVPVSENLPRFVPYIFIALLVNLLLGDAFLWLLNVSNF